MTWVYDPGADAWTPVADNPSAVSAAGQAVADGLLYVIQVDGMARPEYFVKRALVLDTGVYFQSDNPHGDHQWRKPKPMISKRHPITVIGRVHWIGGWAD